MIAEENLYSGKALTIPAPCFVIFYNGEEPPAGPEDPAAVGSLYGKDERSTAGVDSGTAEHQLES